MIARPLRRGGARLRHATAIGLLAVASVFAGATAASAAGLLETSNTSMAFETPAPGHSVEWTMSAKNVSAGSLEARMEVQEISGTATAGNTPLTLSLEFPDGKVLATGAARDLDGMDFPLPQLPSGSSAEVVARVTLPTEAGDEYRGSTALLRFDFVVTADSDSSPGGLSETGASRWLTVLIVSVAIVAVGGGMALVASKRRNTERGAQ